MTIEEQIIQLTKGTLEDLVNLRYDKLKKEHKLTNETEEMLKEIIALQGSFMLPPNDEEMTVDVYEYDNDQGFGAEISYLWFDNEESSLVLLFEAKTNAEKTTVIEFYIETIDA